MTHGHVAHTLKIKPIFFYTHVQMNITSLDGAYDGVADETPSAVSPTGSGAVDAGQRARSPPPAQHQPPAPRQPQTQYQQPPAQYQQPPAPYQQPPPQYQQPPAQYQPQYQQPPAQRRRQVRFEEPRQRYARLDDGTQSPSPSWLERNRVLVISLSVAIVMLLIAAIVFVSRKRGEAPALQGGGVPAYVGGGGCGPVWHDSVSNYAG